MSSEFDIKRRDLGRALAATHTDKTLPKEDDLQRIISGALSDMFYPEEIPYWNELQYRLSMLFLAQVHTRNWQS